MGRKGNLSMPGVSCLDPGHCDPARAQVLLLLSCTLPTCPYLCKTPLLSYPAQAGLKLFILMLQQC